MRYRLIFSRRGRNDLNEIYDYILQNSGEAAADRFVDRIHTYCHGFADFLQRGIRRDDLSPGLRVVGLDRRLSIGFRIVGDRVVFHRFLYRGRQFES